MEWQVVLLGSVVGVVGALPSAYLLEQALRKERSVSVAKGLVSIMFSFAMLSGAIFAVWLVARTHVLVFGVCVVTSFLLVWVVEAIRACYDARRGVCQEERKSGESSR